MAQAFNVLGPLQVLFDGVDVTPTAPKERSLLALLLVNNGRVVSIDRILEELWPRLPVDRGRRVLWVRVAGLRRMLKRADASHFVEFVAPGYRLTVASDYMDVERFFTLVDRGRFLRRTNDPVAAARTLREALDLRGEAITPELAMTEMRLLLGTRDGASVGVSTS